MFCVRNKNRKFHKQCQYTRECTIDISTKAGQLTLSEYGVKTDEKNRLGTIPIIPVKVVVEESSSHSISSNSGFPSKDKLADWLFPRGMKSIMLRK